MPLTLSTPLSLYSIPVVWLTGFFPVVLKTRLIRKSAGFNNVQPRGNVARLAEKKVAPEIVARAARMEAAHMNGMENFPLWAIAALAGNYAGVDPTTLNVVSGLYISLRLLYNYIYFNQETQAQGARRTLVFFAGLTLPLYLLVKSANLVKAGH